MSDKKYEFTGETINVNGHELHQIRYLTDIYTIGDFGKPSRILSEGEIGGWIEREENLSQDGGAFIDETSMIIGNSIVSGDVQIRKKSVIINSIVDGDAEVYNVSIINSKIINGAYIGTGKKSTLVLNMVETAGDRNYINTDHGEIKFVRLYNADIVAPHIDIQSNAETKITISVTVDSDNPFIVNI